MKRKILTIIIILLFIGTSAIPISSSVEKERNDALINREKNISSNVENLFIIGKISNTTVSGDYKKFDIEKIRVISLNPLILITYLYGMCAVTDITGFIGKHYIFSICDIVSCFEIYMLVQNRYPSNHTIEWSVIGTQWGIIDYDPLSPDRIYWKLMNDNGINVSGTTINYSMLVENEIMAGTEIYVQVLQSGYYVLQIYDKYTSLPIFESNREYYP